MTVLAEVKRLSNQMVELESHPGPFFSLALLSLVEAPELLGLMLRLILLQRQTG